MDGSFLSICVIAKNEEKTLPRLIQSLKNVYDQFVVVDTGSTDRTLEIAQELGLEVYQYEWNDSFADARNYACSFARGEWIFCPDCDEIMKEPEEFRTFLEKVSNSVDVVAIDLQLSWDEFGNVLDHFSALRCFRKGTHLWEGRIHEHLVPTTDSPSVVARCNKAWLEHHPDTQKSRGFYMELLRECVERYPDNPRYLFYAGREALSYGLTSEAEDYLKRCLEVHKWDEERCQALLYLAKIYLDRGDEEKSLDYLALAAREYPYRREPFFEMAEIYRSRRDWDKAVLWYKLCLSIPSRQFAYMRYEPIYRELPHLRMSYCYWYMGDIKKAKEAFSRAEGINPDNPELKENKSTFNLPSVSVIIPTRFREDMLNRLLDAMERDEKSYPDLNVIVYRDEGSQPLGCIKSVNAALKEAKGDYICFLGDDCLVTPGWLRNAVFFARSRQDGRVMVAFNNGASSLSFQHFLIHRDLINYLDYNKNSETPKLFCEEYYHSFCDSDLAYQMLYLNKFYWCPNSLVYHSWYADKGTSLGVDRRSMTEEDRLIAEKYEDDKKTFEQRHQSFKREWKFAAILMAHRESENMNVFNRVLSQLEELLPREDIVVVMGPPMYEVGDEKEFQKIYNEDFSLHKNLISMGYSSIWSKSNNESDRRNEVIEARPDVDYFFIINSDELFERGDLQEVKENALENPFVDTWAVSRREYWKFINYRIDPDPVYKPIVLVKRTVRFLVSRKTNGTIHGHVCEVLMHHVGYTKSDKYIKDKMKWLSTEETAQSHKEHSNWYEDIWSKWSSERCEDFKNLHPIYPEIWQRAIREDPPGWLKELF